MASKFKRQRRENVMPTTDQTATEPSLEEILAQADTLTEADAQADAKGGDNGLAPVIFPDASEIADHAAELSGALAGEPVSQSAEPIKLAEPEPARMEVVHAGEVDIIATGDRLDIMRRLVHSDEPVVRSAPPVPNERMQSNLLAEQSAGREALARQRANAEFFPKPERTAAEIARDAPPVEVLRPGGLEHLQARQMLSTPVAGKGEKY